MKKVIVLCICCLVSTFSLAAGSIASLENFVSQNNYSQAWQQAQQLAKANEGDPRFDYLYGLSALETGNYNQAVFALDRVTVNKPNAIRPRLELARAYLKINNDQAALREFREVLNLNPPATVRNNVNRYIQAIAKKSRDSKKWIIDSLVSLSAGYDSNANFGADNSVFDTPVFGQVFLKDESIKQESPFTEVRGQLNYRYITSDDQNWFVNTRLGHKHFQDASDFNLSDFSIQAGSIITAGKKQYQISLHHQMLQLGGESFSRSLGVESGMAYELEKDRIVGGTFRIENYDHQQQNLRDARRYEISGYYRFDTGDTHHRLDVLFGHEQPDNEAGKHHTHNGFGAGYTARHAWNATQVSFFNVQYQKRKHRATDPIYSDKREDDRLLVKVGHSMQLAKDLSAFADVGYIKNNSNLDIYTTDKAFVRGGIKYRF
uniref:Uncharacterized protein n=1 Tax=uncultured Thiotrichaceae bacterium TaxID=298394 RepID=A0A6S6TKA6_9GAMM|nr:MAG: Unknown protein [uncultured Thiotrichaceae bacterium]